MEYFASSKHHQIKIQNTSNSKHRHKGDLCIQFTKNNKNKSDNYFSTCLFQLKITDRQSLFQQLRVQGGTHPGQTPLLHRATPPPAPHSCRQDDGHTTSANRISLGRGRKVESQRKCMQTQEACANHTYNGPCWESIFSTSTLYCNDVTQGSAVCKKSHHFKAKYFYAYALFLFVYSFLLLGKMEIYFSLQKGKT